ncbi:MAG: dipicolinate synthase [Oscillospiraceae bacterium]|nr:dipicolinate synthase [Oscillospiraceae bacterium]
MRFALLGGDLRMAYLRQKLLSDGHAAAALALERLLPETPPDPETVLAPAQAVILPLPAEREGRLNAPWSSRRYVLSELLPLLRPGTVVLAGMPGEALAAECRRLGLPLADYGAQERFLRRNAALTAEAALPLLLEGPRALSDSRVLVSGFGRIGKELTRRLFALGADVTVAARSESARTMAAAMGCRAVELRDAPEPGYDAVVNTVPARLYGEAEERSFAGARLIELASPPYGFDPAGAEAAGNPVLFAPGLPGKCFPASAAEAVRASIYECLKEFGYHEAADRAGPDRLILHL